MSRSFTCPSCGAPLEVEHRFSRVVICGYCNQSANITSGGLDPAGKGAKLVGAPSRLSIGATGRIDETAFRTLGRLRYGYDGGFWDEWFLALSDDRQLWLQEDDGTFTAFEKTPITAALPEFDDVRVGQTITVNGRSIFIVERTEAMILGGEGELYFNVTPGADVFSVDGSADGETWSVEYQPDEITLSRGTPVAHAALELD
ncbi:MAG: DUF4178 domain-containing protein [Pseudomonadota bacterium]